MASPLLDTKFHAPRRRSGIVPRPLLTERLDRSADARLSLISAPAGFGKSTLVAEWLAARPDARPAAAWLSLDAGDNDPGPFWTSVVAALQSVAPGVGADSLSLLDGPDQAIETVLAPLLNDLNALESDVVLVLDDYHVADAPAIQAGMSFMLEHLPPNVHLIITTRADPALPLARLRARGDLVEIRAADLRFTPDEADAYLNGVMTLGLTAGDVATLEGRTEGWIAAIQLAGLSMQGRDDVAGFIADFAGDDRYIVDYLVEEVWHRQPEDVRRFLLQTSILSRLCGPLCDAVTGQGGGKATLETLDRRNLFLIPLDDRRRWYRYHHLFGDVLQARLLDEAPELVPELHRRAAEWYASEGEADDAIRHAMAGGDFSRAADLVELSIPVMSRDRRESVTRRWLAALPDEQVRKRPVLSDSYAGALLVHGEVDGVEGRLADAERWLELTADSLATDGTRPTTMIVTDEAAFRSLPASIAIHRAGLARILGDDAGTVRHARRGLELLGEDEHLGRGGAAALLGLAYWAGGDLEAAHRSYLDAYANLEKAGHLSDLLGLTITLADIRIAQGRLGDAQRMYEQGLALSLANPGPVLRGTADMHVGLSAIARERDDRATATAALRSCQELGEENGLPKNPYRSRVAMARIRQTDGDLDAGIRLLDEAERRYDGDFSPDVQPVAAVRTRVQIVAGRLADAAAWARDRGLSTADDLTYLTEFEHLTLARVLLAHGSRERDDRAIRDVLAFLARLLAAAEDGRRIGSVIDIRIAQALAHQAIGDSAAAHESLSLAIDLAGPEGYVRIFVDEGPPMIALLKAAARQRDAPAYVRRLVAATAPPESLATADQPLIEPLSERELDVLHLLESDLDGPDIARELSVSLPTVRTHTSNIYAKLGVTNRRAAVRRAGELGLLSRGEGHRPTA
jgi:LuxR family maltose regulon positive regulatory protein